MKSRTPKGRFFRSVQTLSALRVFVLCFISSSSILFSASPASALLDLKFQKEAGPEDSCEQSWPVDCGGGNAGGATCGAWRVVKDLAESESLPGTPGGSCSTGVRLALPDGKDTQGQAVGAMFPGKVVFAQSGRSRDGKDYGGTVVVQLRLTDGSPQCFLRYMFLDRRDMVKVGAELTAGQRIGSIASDDMSREREWWKTNWPGMEPNVKIDIGCDEALANMGHFMPYEKFSGGGPEDPDSCPLTKMRFPARPLEYLANTESGSLGEGGRRVCRVGQSKKDARPKFVAAAKQDLQENKAKYDGLFVPQVKPRGLIKRKKTPVYALYEDPDARRDLYGANKSRGVSSPVFRDHKNYARATALGCRDMTELFRGKASLASGTPANNPVFTYGDSVSPERVRELMTHCSNQFILGRGMVAQVYEKPQSYIGGRNPAAKPNEYLSARQVERLSDEDKKTYEDALEDAQEGNKLNYGDLYAGSGNVINKVQWMEQCQPMHMEPVQNVEYKMNELLNKAWQEYLVEWPQDHTLRPINRTAAIPNTPLNDYAKYPYERINDPTHPFAPRNIFAETERERYSNYDVQCAATPVDIILGAYQKTEADKSAEHQNIYSKRDASFHSCVKCRIDINENKEACFADPYSFTNLGGCLAGAPSEAMSGEMCPTFKMGNFPTNNQGKGSPDFKTYIEELATSHGLHKDWLHATATHESSCNAQAISFAGCASGQGMFQFSAPTGASYGMVTSDCPSTSTTNPNSVFNPWRNAIASAEFHLKSAKIWKQKVGGPCPAWYLVYLYGYGQGASQTTRAGVIGNASAADSWIVGYMSHMEAMTGGPSVDVCPGVDENGNLKPGVAGTGTGTPGGGGDADLGNVFGGGGGSASGVIGNFDPAKCPANFFSSIHKPSGYGEATHVSGDMACPALSNPVPDNPHQSADRAGDSNKWWINWGCTRNWGINGGSVGGSTMDACRDMAAQGYNGSKWCPLASCSYSDGNVRMHEGIDHTEMNGVQSLGLPVYAAGNGKVRRTSATSRDLDILHEGYCVVSGTPGNCDEYGAYPSGVRTSYRHMGPRILPEIKDGTVVKRCQQIGTVGQIDAPATGDLHFETHDPANSITKNNNYSDTYWPYDVNQKFFIHPLDKSCGGGITDPDGALSTRGICKFALPLNIEGKEDLTPPEHLSTEDYKFPEVDKVTPGSPKRGDRFDIKKKGMVFQGAWRWCDGSDSAANGPEMPPMTAADRAYCESLPDKPAEEDEEAPKEQMSGGSSAGFINPAPCGPITSPFGPRAAPCAGCSSFHHGLDIGVSYVPILAPADGVVKFAGAQGCGGNYTEITHADGTVTAYMHQSDLCGHKPGDVVKQGEVIGISGNTGSCTTGAHLHFIVKVGGQETDPQPHIPPQSPGDPVCPTIAAAKCGDIITDLPTGGGLGSSGKKLCVDKPCTIRFDLADTVNQCAWSRDFGGCGAYGDFSQRKGDCCFNITAPVAGTNMLKVRPGFDKEARTPGWTPDTNGVEEFIPGAWDGKRTKDEGGNVDVSAANQGAPEGYTFYEFFKDHRPYIRWWDTGAEVGQVLQDQLISDTVDGQYDTLVGVGIEKENCGYGGWGDKTKLDGNTSWMELKLYQARTQQQHALRCIGRYERLFKSGSSEDFVHQLAGGKLDTYFTGSRSLSSSAINFPLGWRGYVSEPTPGYRFPYYRNIGENGVPAAHAAMVGGGLDAALPGDIIIWDEDVVGGKRLPHAAYVMQANNVAIREFRGDQVPLSTATFSKKAEKGTDIDSLVVVDYDNGKYPDACGATNWAGVGPDRVIYKNALPESLVNEATKRGVQSINCGNPDLATCVEPNAIWSKVKVYRPWKQVRQ